MEMVAAVVFFRAFKSGRRRKTKHSKNANAQQLLHIVDSFHHLLQNFRFCVDTMQGFNYIFAAIPQMHQMLQAEIS
jgi:hypothetical protein